jgi:hypothetical protein
METLKSLREKVKALRGKVSAAPVSKATPDQLRSEITMLERAVKADEKVQMKKALKEASVVPLSKEKEKDKEQKKKITVPLKKTSPMDDREKELAKREKELAKKEKMILAYKPQAHQRETSEDTESESDDY